MRLRTLLLVIGIAFMGAQVFAACLYYYNIFVPNLTKLERSIVEKKLHRDIGAIHRELYYLERISLLFMQLPLINQIIKPEQETLNDNTKLVDRMLEYDFNYIALLDTTHHVIFEKLMDLNAEKPLPNQPIPSLIWDKKPSFFKHESKTSVYSGFISTPIGPMIVISLPLLAQNSEKIIGTAIIGRLFTTEMMDLLRSITLDDFKVLSLDQLSLNDNYSDIIKNLNKEELFQYIQTTPDQQIAYMILQDINQSPTLLMGSTLNRQLTKQSQILFIQLSVVFITLELLLLCTLFFVISQRITKRNLRLIKDLHNPDFDWHLQNDAVAVHDIDLLRAVIAQRLASLEEKLTRDARINNLQDLAIMRKHYIHELEAVLHLIQKGVQHCESALTALPVNELESIIASKKAMLRNQQEWPDDIKSLVPINKKLERYQKEMRVSLLELYNKLMRHFASIKSQSRNLNTLKEFTPLQQRSETSST